MTIRDMISLARNGLKAIGKLRYETGTTTSSGATDGTTFIDTATTGVDDAYNNAEIKITSGDNIGQRREIGDWVNSTNTGTVIAAFTHRVLTSITFEIGEKQFISDHELIELFTQAQDELIVMLAPDAFPAHTTLAEVVGTGGLSAALPATLAGPPRSLQFRDSAGVEHDVVVLPPGEKDRFTEDAFLGSALNDMVAIWENGIIKYRPVNDGTLLLPIVAQFAAVTFASGSPFPSYLHQLIVKYAVWKGWLSRKRTDMGAIAQQDFGASVAAINSQYTEMIKQTQQDE